MATPFTTDITAGPGGVMTDEVGIITGDVTVRTDVDPKGSLVVKVQYKDADEWYTVTGARTTLRDPKDADAVHALVVALLNRPSG